jgi:hypothetical protein
VQEATVPLRSPRQKPVLPVVRQRHLRAQPVGLIVLAVDEGLDVCGEQETPCSGGALLPPYIAAHAGGIDMHTCNRCHL